ncbi:hypothetical protein GCM10011497_28330 [Elstera cyanobacteriorum]|nr:hypothetical protein [Elstera cyanobacteriorum]GFZ96099.1 hypothetical protein GCM10011497_28330 [Elstera cyanobacteriorum]
MTDGRTYIFHLTPYTPETLSLGRLAEYATALAEVFGHRDSVHLRGIDAGSVKLALKIDDSVVTHIEARLADLATGAGPEGARSAIKRITEFLTLDGGTATLEAANDSAAVLTFPAPKPPLPPVSVTEVGCLDGRVLRLGGSGEKKVTVLLETDIGRITCDLHKSKAKEMAPYLFDWVRVTGVGVWERSPQGKWFPSSFTINTFDPLDDEGLADVLARLRSLGAGWPDSETIQKTLREIRD